MGGAREFVIFIWPNWSGRCLRPAVQQCFCGWKTFDNSPPLNITSWTNYAPTTIIVMVMMNTNIGNIGGCKICVKSIINVCHLSKAPKNCWTTAKVVTKLNKSLQKVLKTVNHCKPRLYSCKIIFAIVLFSIRKALQYRFSILNIKVCTPST